MSMTLLNERYDLQIMKDEADDTESR